jgi:hypothetical protein
MQLKSRQMLYLQGLRLFAVAAGVVVTAGCSDTTGPSGAVRIVPAASTVNMQTTPQGRVLSTSVTITNNSPYVVVYSSCGVTLEMLSPPALPPGKREWTMVWGRICALLAASASFSTYPGPETLQPGESVTIPIVAIAGTPYSTFSGQPGQYRFHVALAIRILGSYHNATPEQSVSEPFVLDPAA